MDSMRRRLLSLTVLIPLAGVLAACDNDGPAEEAGEAIDETADEVGDAVDDAAD